jgi:type IV pilus assembly protein PilB
MVGKMKLGEFLLEAGLINKEQLKKALARHRKTGMKLGQFLVQRSIVSEPDIMKVLADQLKLKIYSPSRHGVDPRLAEIVPFEMANKYQLAPFDLDGALLRVATTDPLGIRALDAIEDKTQMEVETFICSEQHLIQLHKRLYGPSIGIGEILKGMEEVQIEDELEKTAETEDVEVSILHGMAEKAPVVRLANSIISQAVQEGASDIHISPQKDYIRLRFRIDGRLHEVLSPPRHLFLPLVSRLKILSGMDIAVSRKAQDGRFNVKMRNRDINVRASTIPSIYGENVVLRLLDTSAGVYSLAGLGMTENDIIKLEAMISRTSTSSPWRTRWSTASMTSCRFN